MRAWVLIMLGCLVTAGCAAPDGGDTAPNPTTPCGALDGFFQVDKGFNPSAELETSRGTITLNLFFNQVPVTAQNFISLAKEGFFDGTRFHYLQPDVVIRGGNPHSARDDKSRWAVGDRGPGYTIADEFHQFLRHSDAGVVSMVNAKPNDAGSRFAIHLQDRPALDDQFAVFAEVTDGLAVARQISQTPVDDRNRPEFDAKLEEVRILDPEKPPTEATIVLSSFGYDCEQVAEPGGKAEFLVSVRNTGQRILNGTFEPQLPAGWDAELRNAEQVVVPSGQTVAYAIDVTVPESAEVGTSEQLRLAFNATTSPETTGLDVTVDVEDLGTEVVDGSTATVNYVAILEDGRPFDTTEEAFLDYTSLRWFKPPPQHLAPLTLEMPEGELEGQGITVPDGLADLINRAKAGQSVVGLVPPEDGYGADAFGEKNLGGRLILFQVHVQSVQTPEAS